MNSAAIIALLTAIVPAVLAITLHEAAHGYAALALGDDTARRAGRLSLNPLRHIDRVGTIILPGLLLLFQLVTIGRVAFLFGWAKPVPVSAWRFRDPRRAMMLVAAAGPLMNFFLACIGGLLLPDPVGLPPDAVFTIGGFLDAVIAQSPIWGELVLAFMSFNLVLGLFNLLPIPPLDGGRIVVGLLPEPLARAWANLERAGIFIVLLFIFLLPRLLAGFGIAFDPMRTLLGTVLPAALRFVLQITGHPVGPGGGDALFL